VNTVPQLLMVLGFAIVGLLLAGFILWYRTRRFIAKTHRATGVVLKVKIIPFENKDTFAPVVRFTTRDGRALSFTDPVSKYPAEFEVGERTQVLYDPKDPHRARAVRNISDLFLAARIFVVAGIALLAMLLLVGMVLGTLTYLPVFFQTG
jgi:hypothetical protein